MAVQSLSRPQIESPFTVEPTDKKVRSSEIVKVLSAPVKQVAKAVDNVKSGVEAGVGAVADRVGLVDRGNGVKAGPVPARTMISIAKKSYSAAMKVLKAIPTRVSGGIRQLKEYDFKLIGAGMFVAGLIFLPDIISTAAKAPLEVYRASNIRDQVSAAFKGLEAATDLTGYVVATSGMFYEFGLIGAQAVAWIPIAGPILTALGTVSIALNAFGMDDAYSVKRDMDRFLDVLPREVGEDGVELYSTDALRRTLEYIADADAKFVKKQFNVHYDVTKDAQVALERLNAGDDIQADASKLMDQLRGRLNARMRSHTLKMVSGGVSLIALPLILSGPTATVGAGFAAGAAILKLVQVVHDVRAFNREPQRFERLDPSTKIVA
jgi:hypothetical protein